MANHEERAETCSKAVRQYPGLSGCCPGRTQVIPYNSNVARTCAVLNSFMHLNSDELSIAVTTGCST